MQTRTIGQASEASELAGHLQVFVYRTPKQNHDAIVGVQDRLKGIFRQHGTLDSEYYQLSPTEPFKGFKTLAGSISASEEEEVWLELDFYTDQKNRDQVMARIAQDPAFRQLLGEERALFSPGTTVLQNEFSRIARL